MRRPQTVRELLDDRTVKQPNGCWIWTGHVAKNGYGTLTAHGRNTTAHRWSYEEHVGPIPAGLEIDHLCRVRRCVNPEHLEPVTRKENLLRSGLVPTTQNALRTHCTHGHEFTEDNTYRHAGRRYCKTCQRERQARKVSTPESRAAAVIRVREWRAKQKQR